MIVTSRYLVPKGYAAITIFPFIFLHDRKMKLNPVLLNHERIHLRQQAEMLVLPFYLWYVTEYIFNRLVYKDKKTAYRNISFEREAYANESDLNYLKNRPVWSFVKFLGRRN